MVIVGGGEIRIEILDSKGSRSVGCEIYWYCVENNEMNLYM